jgi:hypothetical protein
MKISSDTIGNLTRDPPACSAESQPTAPPRVPCNLIHYIHIVLCFILFYNNLSRH